VKCQIALEVIDVPRPRFIVNEDLLAAINLHSTFSRVVL
jgi:hypothetical protein